MGTPARPRGVPDRSGHAGHAGLYYVQQRRAKFVGKVNAGVCKLEVTNCDLKINVRKTLYGRVETTTHDWDKTIDTHSGWPIKKKRRKNE